MRCSTGGFVMNEQLDRKVESPDTVLDARSSILSPRQRALRRFRQNRLAIASTWLLFAVIVCVLAWPIALKIASFTGPNGAAFSKNYQPEKLSDAQFQPPSFKHWF